MTDLFDTFAGIARSHWEGYKKDGDIDIGTRGMKTLLDGQDISAVFLTEHMTSEEVKPVIQNRICVWCGIVFAPTSHNYVYLGGKGSVYGCNRCLKLRSDKWFSKYLTKADIDKMIRDTLKIVEPTNGQEAEHLFQSFSKLPTDELVAYAYEQGRKDEEKEKK